MCKQKSYNNVKMQGLVYAKVLSMVDFYVQCVNIYGSYISIYVNIYGFLSLYLHDYNKLKKMNHEGNYFYIQAKREEKSKNTRLERET